MGIFHSAGACGDAVATSGHTRPIPYGLESSPHCVPQPVAGPSQGTHMLTALTVCWLGDPVIVTDGTVMVLAISMSSCFWKSSCSSCTEKSSLG